MTKKQMSLGEFAFRIYNKTNASPQEKKDITALLACEKREEIDVFGWFVRAQIAFDNFYSSKQKQESAFKTFLKIARQLDTPVGLKIGARYYAGKCYELGLGTDKNRKRALECYVKANKLNGKACKKDILRMESVLNAPPPKRATDTPEEFSYKFNSCDTDEDGLYEEQYDEIFRYRSECAQDHLECMKALRETGFYYPDDPEEVSLNDLDAYCVKGVKLKDLLDDD